jgi:predicted PurR-regulated permease PerM
MKNDPRSKLEHNLGWAVLVLLLLGCLIVLRPFASALLWAAVLCFASWPLYERLLRWAGNRRTLVSLGMTLGWFVLILLPFLIIGSSLIDNIYAATGAVRGWMEKGPPEPPDWLGKIPVFGEQAVEHWRVLAHDSARLWAESRHLVEMAGSWLLKASLSLGRGLLGMGLSIFIAFFLFRDGHVFARRLNRTVDRIGGERGRRLLAVASETIRGVVYGILGTALLEASLMAIGFMIAGVPGVGLLLLFAFFASIIPGIGIIIVWLPVAIWLIHQGSTGLGIFVMIWGFCVSSLINIIRPWIISHGSHMPFLLIFFGVIGGAVAFGFIGLFLGPTLLAVGFRLAEEWTSTAHDAIPVKENGGKPP